MKYARVVSGKTSPNGDYGVIRGDMIYVLSASPLDEKAEETGVSFPVKDVETYLPPVSPPNIVALGLNYAAHARESNMEPPEEPVVFLKASTALTGHLSPVILPTDHPDEVDYEAELAVIIGKKAKNIPENEILDYVFGYTCSNDVSARDCQMRFDRQWARAKSFDSFAPLGPWIETELDASDIKIETRLNGKTMQSSGTKDLIFKLPRLLSFLSRQMTLLPGTVVMTGTPSGVGYGRTPGVYLRPGDTVEIDIEGIGVLKNPVVREV